MVATRRRNSNSNTNSNSTNSTNPSTSSSSSSSTTSQTLTAYRAAHAERLAQAAAAAEATRNNIKSSGHPDFASTQALMNALASKTRQPSFKFNNSNFDSDSDNINQCNTNQIISSLEGPPLNPSPSGIFDIKKCSGSEYIKAYNLEFYLEDGLKRLERSGLTDAHGVEIINGQANMQKNYPVPGLAIQKDGLVVATQQQLQQQQAQSQNGNESNSNSSGLNGSNSDSSSANNTTTVTSNTNSNTVNSTTVVTTQTNKDSTSTSNPFSLDTCFGSNDRMISTTTGQLTHSTIETLHQVMCVNSNHYTNSGTISTGTVQTSTALTTSNSNLGSSDYYLSLQQQQNDPNDSDNMAQDHGYQDDNQDQHYQGDNNHNDDNINANSGQTGKTSDYSNIQSHYSRAALLRGDYASNNPNSDNGDVNMIMGESDGGGGPGLQYNQQLSSFGSVQTSHHHHRGSKGSLNSHNQSNNSSNTNYNNLNGTNSINNNGPGNTDQLYMCLDYLSSYFFGLLEGKQCVGGITDSYSCEDMGMKWQMNTSSIAKDGTDENIKDTKSQSQSNQQQFKQSIHQSSDNHINKESSSQSDNSMNNQTQSQTTAATSQSVQQSQQQASDPSETTSKVLASGPLTPTPILPIPSFQYYYPRSVFIRLTQLNRRAFITWTKRRLFSKLEPSQQSLLSLQEFELLLQVQCPDFKLSHELSAILGEVSTNCTSSSGVGLLSREFDASKDVILPTNGAALEAWNQCGGEKESGLFWGDNYNNNSISSSQQQTQQTKTSSSSSFEQDDVENILEGMFKDRPLFTLESLEENFGFCFLHESLVSKLYNQLFVPVDTNQNLSSPQTLGMLRRESIVRKFLFDRCCETSNKQLSKRFAGESSISCLTRQHIEQAFPEPKKKKTDINQNLINEEDNQDNLLIDRTSEPVIIDSEEPLLSLAHTVKRLRETAKKIPPPKSFNLSNTNSLVQFTSPYLDVEGARLANEDAGTTRVLTRLTQEVLVFHENKVLSKERGRKKKSKR